MSRIENLKKWINGIIFFIIIKKINLTQKFKLFIKLFFIFCYRKLWFKFLLEKIGSSIPLFTTVWEWDFFFFFWEFHLLNLLSPLYTLSSNNNNNNKRRYFSLISSLFIISQLFSPIQKHQCPIIIKKEVAIKWFDKEFKFLC